MPSRRRGRPFGRSPVFLVDCSRLDATALLAKSRGAQFNYGGQTAPEEELSGYWTLQWTEDGRPHCRTVGLTITTTGQHLGGVRRWWRCPVCRRRCRVLLALTPLAPIGCRVCIRARYCSDYPARDRRRRFVELLRSFGKGTVDQDCERELDLLLARRRRGVRRGRRIVLRAARALGRLNAQCSAITDILKTGGL